MNNFLVKELFRFHEEKNPIVLRIVLTFQRLDIQLVAKIARLKPEWQIVLIGPVVKIDPLTIPRESNIHYLGGKE